MIMQRLGVLLAKQNLLGRVVDGPRDGDGGDDLDECRGEACERGLDGVRGEKRRGVGGERTLVESAPTLATKALGCSIAHAVVHLRMCARTLGLQSSSNEVPGDEERVSPASSLKV